MRANWTAMHDAFQDEIERLSGSEQYETVEQIAYMLVRYLPASRLDAARAELKRDGIDVLGEEDGTGGQDRESYTDAQDRETYTTIEEDD